MADMLGSRGNGSCMCCNDPLVPRRVNRKREAIDWQRDMESGEHSQPIDMSDGDLDHEWGGLADYMATPASYRDPLHPYGETHYRPMRHEDHERIEMFKSRMAERVKRIREERLNG